MRKRMINPSIWTNRKFLRCNNTQKLLFIGLISIADDYGKLWYDLLSFKASIFPCENITEEELISHLEKLSELNLIITDLNIVKIHGWKNHQFVPKPQDSVIPDPKIRAKKTQNEQESTDTLPLQYQYSNNTVTIMNESSNDPTKERKKERNKEKDLVDIKNRPNQPSEKEKLTEGTRMLLEMNEDLFSSDEVDELKKLIREGKNITASAKIYEKLEEIPIDSS